MPLTNQTIPDYFKTPKVFTLLLYGDYGTGKTIFAASGQEHTGLANLAFIASDPGTASIASNKSENIYQIDFNVVKDLTNLPGYLRSTLPHVKTVVFDSIAALGALRLVELEGSAQVTDLRNYGELLKNITRILTDLRESGYNIIMTAGVKDEGVTVDMKFRPTFRRPNCTPGLWNMLSYFSGNIWHTYLSADQSYNLLIRPSFSANGMATAAKSRNEKYNALLKPLERANYPGVIQIGKVGESSDKYPKLDKLYELYLESLRGSSE